MQTFAFFVYFFVVSYASGSYVQPSVWPNPASITFGDITYGEMDSNIPFVVTDGTSSTLMMAYDRYQKLMFPHPVNTTTASTQIVRVTVANLSDAYPQLSTNESYTITISPPSSSSELVIDITAETVYGTLRAYETLSQLISYDFSTNKYSVPYSLNVRDSPRFPHRGILLDTSRHFMPISTLQLFVDSLVYAKFNVLHWHVVDTQSFPYQSVARPNLWFGAYSLWERYSQQEIKNLIEYARQRGVKIMIEFDMPGHGASWCKGYPEICPAADCPQPLNPASDETFKVINDLMAEITGHDSYTAYDPNQPPAASFPYELLHLGGDEVSENYPCWDNNPAIVSWQQARGLDDDGTYLYFVNGTAAVARANERTAVQWVEVFEEFGSALNKDTVVHVWKDKSTLNNVLQAGYKAIISDQADWYLDHEDVTWEQMYRNEPTQGLSPGIDVDALLIGGEACMWDERVDPSVVFNTVWPRAAAVAERLWSPLSATDSSPDLSTATNRMETFRCLLQTRGVGAAPATNPVARVGPVDPSSCYTQLGQPEPTLPPSTVVYEDDDAVTKNAWVGFLVGFGTWVLLSVCTVLLVRRGHLPFLGLQATDPMSKSLLTK